MTKPTMVVSFQALTSTAMIPTYAHEGDAGADLYADEHVILHKNGGRAIVSTGVSIAIPEGYVCLVHPRSGLAFKHGVTVVNTPGTVDAGYRGEVKVAMINHGPDHVAFAPGDRVAQLVFQKVERALFVEEELPDSVRGVRGFGSTG